MTYEYHYEYLPSYNSAFNWNNIKITIPVVNMFITIFCGLNISLFIILQEIEKFQWSKTNKIAVIIKLMFLNFLLFSTLRLFPYKSVYVDNIHFFLVYIKGHVHLYFIVYIKVFK